ncbi:hypothetical protein ACIXOD_11110 [Bacteroides fragilis]
MGKKVYIPPGNLRLCENGDKIRMYIGTTYRDLSITFARSFAGLLRTAADRLANKQQQKDNEKP